jgi:hypothetical protein
MAESNEQYKALWENGPVRVRVIMGNTRVGAGGRDGDSGNLCLEATLVSENEDTLVLKDISTINCHRNGYYGSIDGFTSSKAAIPKHSAQVYLIEEKKDG